LSSEIYPKIFEISLTFPPPPFRWGRVRVDRIKTKDLLVPPPLHPLPPGEGRFLGGIEKMLEENSRI